MRGPSRSFHGTLGLRPAEESRSRPRLPNGPGDGGDLGIAAANLRNHARRVCRSSSMSSRLVSPFVRRCARRLSDRSHVMTGATPRARARGRRGQRCHVQIRRLPDAGTPPPTGAAARLASGRDSAPEHSAGPVRPEPRRPSWQLRRGGPCTRWRSPTSPRRRTQFLRARLGRVAGAHQTVDRRGSRLAVGRRHAGAANSAAVSTACTLERWTGWTWLHRCSQRRRDHPCYTLVPPNRGHGVRRRPA